MQIDSINLRTTTMKDHKMTANQIKILKGMEMVYDKLIEFKIKMNSELVILKDDKIVRVKPESHNLENRHEDV